MMIMMCHLSFRYFFVLFPLKIFAGLLLCANVVKNASFARSERIWR